MSMIPTILIALIGLVACWLGRRQADRADRLEAAIRKHRVKALDDEGLYRVLSGRPPECDRPGNWSN